MHHLADISIDPRPEPARVRQVDAEQLARAEAVDRAELESRGVPPRVSAATRSTWEVERRGPDGRVIRAQWYVPGEEVSPYDAWPGGMTNTAGEHPRWLLLHGDSGCGKSHVAAWIMRRFIVSRATKIVACRHDHTPAPIPGGSEPWSRTLVGATWIDVPAVMAEILDQRYSGSQERHPQLDHPFVVLDDVGAERSDRGARATDERELLELWVRLRNERRGFTVATTNLGEAELRDRYGRTASRLAAGPVIHMRGGDARRQAWRVSG